MWSLLLVNHRFPSEPEVMALGSATPAGAPSNESTCPWGVIRPMRLLPGLVNHRLPSPPVTISPGKAISAALVSNVVICPSGVMRPTGPSRFVNHKLPSGPAGVLGVEGPPRGGPAE